jgi:hypothetical protein
MAMSTTYDGGSAINNGMSLKVQFYLYSSIPVARKNISILGGSGCVISSIRTLRLKPDVESQSIINLHPTDPSLVNPMIISTSSSDDIGYTIGIGYPSNVDIIFDNEIISGILYARIHTKEKESPATGYMPLKIVADKVVSNEIEGTLKNKTSTEIDLNNYTETGSYWIHTGAVNNKPSNVEYGYFLLEVNKQANDLVYQKLWTRERIHTRAKIQSNTFSAWKSVALS